MNLSSIISEVRQELQEATASEFTEAEITAYINDGNLLVAQLMEWYEKFAFLIPVVGQQDYTLTSDIINRRRTTFDREFLPDTTQYELDRDEGNWRGAGNSTPIRCFMKQWDTLSLYPKPVAAGVTITFDAELGVAAKMENPSGTVDPDVTFDSEFGLVIALEDTAGGHVKFEADRGVDPFTTTSAELGIMIDYDTDEDNVAIYYSAIPDTLVASTDVPQIHQAAHPALIPYAVFRCFQREGAMQDLGLAELYFRDFADWMTAVMTLKGRQWPERVLSLEPEAMGNHFVRRLNEIGMGSLTRAESRAHYE